MNLHACLASLSVVFALPSSLLADDRAVQLLSAAVRDQAGIADDRRVAVERALGDVFGPSPALPVSQEQALVEDFKAFAQDRLWRSAMSGDEAFALVLDTATWSMKNAARMPVPSERDEAIADQAVAAIEDALEVVVGEAYADVPAASREKLVRDTAARIEQYRGTLVNVFYPETLSPAVERFEQAQVVAQLLDHSGLHGARERWRPVTEILASKDLSQDSKDIQIGFFVEREALFIADAARDVLRTWFVMPQEAVDAYENIPADLLTRHGAQRAQFEERLRKQREEDAAKEKSRKGRELLKEAGVATPGGRPVPPAPNGGGR